MTAPLALRLILIVAAVGVLVACGSYRTPAVAPRCGSGGPPTSAGASASRGEADAIRAAVRNSKDVRAVRGKLVRACTIINIRVSRLDRRFASATMNAYGLEHALVLLRRDRAWNVIALGTDLQCRRYIPRRILFELLPECRRNS